MRYVVERRLRPYLWQPERYTNDIKSAYSAAAKINADHVRIRDLSAGVITPVRPHTPNHNTNSEEKNQLHKRLTRTQYIKRKR